MALKFNNTEITQVVYNGEERTSVMFNNVGYFGKRYSLTQNTSTGVGIYVNRTSSPNQQAGTGSIVTGNTIYYGDVITMSVSANANYSSPKLYVDIGDGSGMIQRTSPFSFTVGGDVSFSGSATYNPPNPWETIWTGSQTFTSSGSLIIPGLSVGDSVRLTANAHFTQEFYDFDGTFLPDYTQEYSNGTIDATLPMSLYGNNSYIWFTHEGDKIRFNFIEDDNGLKGVEIYEYPDSLTITEVRRQR